LWRCLQKHKKIKQTKSSFEAI